ncbi:MAG: T9SS type A sorting domain-containing protein [Bacteroidales bacterium]|nr:T9SS type A sorting domain-containing protein [Bacteroidales bacterium]MCF8403685.1 T9SS type A sorting domain-containing protein [Bacteroidales bacterium]
MIDSIAKSILQFILSFVVLVFSATAQIHLVPYDTVNLIRNSESLQNPWAGGLNCPQFSTIDLNNDGLEDLVAFERNFYGAVKTYINTGDQNAHAYNYAPEYAYGFPAMHNWMLLRDYNCDGKEDIFTSVPAGIAVYKNVTIEGGLPTFELVTSLLQTIGLEGVTPLFVSPPDVPAIVDIDNDGDLDILTFNTLGSTIEYHKNMTIENNGNCSQLDFELANACWGYFSEDGNNNSVTLYDTCDSKASIPEKSAKHAGSTMLAIDLSGNGVKDLVLGDLTYKNLMMLTNGGTTTNSIMTAFDDAFPSNSTPVNLTVFPAAYHFDYNNDGLKDLVVAPNNPNTSENYQNIWFYQNNGTQDIPEFVYQGNYFLQESMLDVGERSYPVFFDENGDGLMDIIVGNYGYFIETGNYSSRLMLLRNTGSIVLPEFEIISDDYSALGQLGFEGIYPSFGDMDDDGDMDMLIGDEEGSLHYFRNDGVEGDSAIFTLTQPNYNGIDIGQSAKPQIIDVNRDGLPDLLVGERSGTVNYFENTGTPENPAFNTLPSIEEFGQVDVMPECCTGYSAPHLVEDSLGNYMLYVGSEQGYIYQFTNIENNLNGSFYLMDSLYLHGVNISLNGFDINNDGKKEFVYGEFAGGIGLLKDGIPGGLGVRDQRDDLGINIYPNPTSNLLILNFEENNNFEVSIFNYQGEEVFLNGLKKKEEKNLELNVMHLTPGIYFIILQNNENEVFSKKFIKK